MIEANRVVSPEARRANTVDEEDFWCNSTPYPSHSLRAASKAHCHRYLYKLPLSKLLIFPWVTIEFTRKA